MQLEHMHVYILRMLTTCELRALLELKNALILPSHEQSPIFLVVHSSPYSLASLTRRSYEY